MSALAKAELQVLDKNDKATDTIAVQFNPTTMQLQMSNSIDGGTSRGRQTQQYNGSASTQLSLDLQFDTAEEGSNGDPVDVRSRTNQVRQFVLPGGAGSKEAPPRVRFRWGTFELAGVMNSLTEELSLFSRDGVPLRSKLTVQIKEQDARFAALESGPGANQDKKPGAAGAGGSGAGPGGSGGGPIDRAAAALSGESAADFLARNGLPPEAWRALGDTLTALGDGIELQAGLSIGFDASLSAGLGLDVSSGVHLGLGASVDVALGLEGDAGSRASARTGLQQGFALSAAGGPTRAVEQARDAEASAAADSARTSFGAAPRAATAAPVAAKGAPRTPLATSTSARTQPPEPAAPATPPVRADRRAISYGRGVPLRDRVEVPGAESEGYVVVGARDPSTPQGRTGAPVALAPWERLRPSRARSAADRRHERTAPGCHCGCEPWGPGDDCGASTTGSAR